MLAQEPRMIYGWNFSLEPATGAALAKQRLREGFNPRPGSLSVNACARASTCDRSRRLATRRPLDSMLARGPKDSRRRLATGRQELAT